MSLEQWFGHSDTFYTFWQQQKHQNLVGINRSCLKWTDKQKEHHLWQYPTSQSETPKRNHTVAWARLFYCQLILGSLTQNLGSVNRWGSCVCSICACEPHLKLEAPSLAKKQFSSVFLCSLPSICRLTDKQAPQHNALFPERKRWTARLYCRG